MSDDDLKEQLRALKQQGPTPRAGFTDAVMQQVALRRRPERRWSLWAALARPRALTIHFRLSHLVVAGAACVAAGLFVGERLGPRGAPVQHAEVAPSPSSQPVRVRFAILAKNARSVSLVGDFNGWRPEATPLERGADGTWTVTVPLSPGSWAYSFFVDGAFVEDPYAETYRADGFGGRNAIVRVGG